ncbi:MAG: hypothetical protein KCHDKBKB_01171 [Elusimicrobia bacterium]|nr:hypothetical protein [Elusimicrobiota bacterium]
MKNSLWPTFLATVSKDFCSLLADMVAEANGSKQIPHQIQAVNTIIPNFAMGKGSHPRISLSVPTEKFESDGAHSETKWIVGGWIYSNGWLIWNKPNIS